MSYKAMEFQSLDGFVTEDTEINDEVKQALQKDIAHFDPAWSRKRTPCQVLLQFFINALPGAGFELIFYSLANEWFGKKF